MTVGGGRSDNWGVASLAEPWHPTNAQVICPGSRPELDINCPYPEVSGAGWLSCSPGEGANVGKGEELDLREAKPGQGAPETERMPTESKGCRAGGQGGALTEGGA